MKKWLISVVVLLVVIVGVAYYGYNDYMKTSSDAILPVLGTYHQKNIEVKQQSQVSQLNHLNHLNQKFQRSFNYYLPKNLIENPAIVFVLHGSKGTGNKVRFQSGYQYDYLAENKGEFIVVYPDGYQNHWNDCRASASYAANTENIDDPAFFNQMIDYFVAEHNGESERVFATGFSNGGHMVYRLGLEMPERFTALAAIAANLPVDENSDCLTSDKPVSIAIFNGTKDPINPYEGGLVNVFGDTSRGSVLSTLDTLKYWVDLAQLDQSHESILTDNDNDNSTSVIKTTWTKEVRSEKENKEVRLYTLKGSGHVMPSKVVDFAQILGGNAQDIAGAEEIWTFFQATQ